MFFKIIYFIMFVLVLIYKCEIIIVFFINWIKLILNVYNNEIGFFII